MSRPRGSESPKQQLFSPFRALPDTPLVDPPEKRRGRYLTYQDSQEIIDTISVMKEQLDEHLAPLQQLSAHINELERKMVGLRKAPGKKSTPRKFLEILESTIITRTILLFSIIFQALNIVVVDLLDWKHWSLGSILVMTGFQLLHMLFMVLVSAKLVHSATVGHINIWFILQSYLSTAIMFAGIYLLLHIRDSTAFFGLDAPIEKDCMTFCWYIDLLNFSIGVMSAGISKVVPARWYAELVVSCQMLVAMVYWMFILGFGIDVASRASSPPAPEEYQGEEPAEDGEAGNAQLDVDRVELNPMHTKPL